MNNIFLFVIIIFIIEVILAFSFAAIAQIFYQKIGLDFKSIAKGFIERIFLLITLLNDYPHALTLFSALKLATRLKHNDIDKETENKFNDFYLIGNMVSVIVAISYIRIFKYLLQNI
jgi:hypothetical protein